LQIELSKKFQNKLRAKVNKYVFEVGVLDPSKPHYEPKKDDATLTGNDPSMSANITTYAGGPIRKASRAPTSTVGAVGKAMREHIGGNYLIDPFKKKDDAVNRMIKDFFKLIFGKSKIRRLENLLQAVVRNPILKGQYGSNLRYTVQVKGFDRYGFNTGQWFKSIKAKVKKASRV
jgi:hypothetical protein